LRHRARQGGVTPAGPAITVQRIGHEAQPLVVIDNFAADPDALRMAAKAARFGPAAHHYPGLRAHLPETYFTDQEPLITSIVCDVFGHRNGFELIDASFSMVTRTPAALTVKQRLPHCDSFAIERIALVHYLSPHHTDGTAFYRHRSSGFETIDETRAPTYFDRMNAELADGGAPSLCYVANDTPLFERTTLVEARYNRALIYRSYLLHSGAIEPGAALYTDPATGRLTVTAFLSAR
jgi:Family of unknown function (DUF6445)